MSKQASQIWLLDSTGRHHPASSNTDGKMIIVYEREQQSQDLLTEELIGAGTSAWSSTLDIGTSFVDSKIGTYWTSDAASSVDLIVDQEVSYNGSTWFPRNAGTSIQNDYQYLEFDTEGRYNRFNVFNHDASGTSVSMTASYFNNI